MCAIFHQRGLRCFRSPCRSRYISRVLDALYEFAQAWSPVARSDPASASIVVHCGPGVSRSAASALLPPEHLFRELSHGGRPSVSHSPSHHSKPLGVPADFREVGARLRNRYPRGAQQGKRSVRILRIASASASSDSLPMRLAARFQCNHAQCFFHAANGIIVPAAELRAAGRCSGPSAVNSSPRMYVHGC